MDKPLLWRGQGQTESERSGGEGVGSKGLSGGGDGATGGERVRGGGGEASGGTTTAAAVVRVLRAVMDVSGRGRCSCRVRDGKERQAGCGGSGVPFLLRACRVWV